MSKTTTTTMRRPAVVALLNEALSAEYNSFIGHALASNPFVMATPSTFAFASGAHACP